MEHLKNRILDQYELLEITKVNIAGVKGIEKAFDVLGQEGWSFAGTIIIGVRNCFVFNKKIQDEKAEFDFNKKAKYLDDLKPEKSISEKRDIGIDEHFKSTLVDAEIISKEQWKQAQKIQETKNIPIEKCLIELEHITENEANQLLELYFGAPMIKLSQHVLKSKALKLFPETKCRELKFIPVSLEENILTIAMADPRDTQTLEIIKKSLQKEIRIVYASLDDIQKTIEIYYPES